MKHFYLLLPLLAFPFLAAAQSNYEPGYYITLKGDTVRGYIDYKEWSLNPEDISFKADAKALARTRLVATEIREFAVKGAEIYYAYNGPITADNLGNTNGRDTSTRNRSVFLKLLTRGDKLALLEYRNEAKRSFFIAKPAEAAKELIYRSYQQDDQTIDERTYRKQLSVIASQNDKLTTGTNSLIQRTDYDDDDIIRVVNAINDVSYKQENDSQNVNSVGFYVSVNANITQYKITGFIKDAGATNKTSVLPGVVGGVNVYANPRTRQLILRVEAGADLSRFNNAYTSKQSPYNDVVYEFNQLNVFVAPQVLYNLYNQADFKFYIGAGMQASIVSYSGKKFQNADGTATTLPVKPFDHFLKSATVGVIRLGVLVHKNIEVDVRYTTPNDVSQDPYYAMNVSGFHLGVNYHFK